MIHSNNSYPLLLSLPLPFPFPHLSIYIWHINTTTFTIFILCTVTTLCVYCIILPMYIYLKRLMTTFPRIHVFYQTLYIIHSITAQFSVTHKTTFLYILHTLTTHFSLTLMTTFPRILIYTTSLYTIHSFTISLTCFTFYFHTTDLYLVIFHIFTHILPIL